MQRGGQGAYILGFPPDPRKGSFTLAYQEGKRVFCFSRTNLNALIGTTKRTAEKKKEPVAAEKIERRKGRDMWSQRERTKTWGRLSRERELSPIALKKKRREERKANVKRKKSQQPFVGQRFFYNLKREKG